MFVRDARTGNLLPGNMTWLSGMGGASADLVTDTTPTGDPVFQQIRTLAHMMAPIQQRINRAVSGVSNADATVDMDSLAADVIQLQGMHAEFYNLVQQWKGANPYAHDLNLANDYLAFLADWAQGMIQAIPETIAAVPNAVVDGLGNIASHGGQVAFGAILPWLAVGGAVLVFLKYAEKSRTFNKVVA